MKRILFFLSLLAIFAGSRSAHSAISPLPASRVGDVNGDGSITIVDATLALLDALGLQTLPADQRAVAGLGAAKPTVKGAQAILKAALGVGALPWFCGYSWLEGPSVLADGTLVFTDYTATIHQVNSQGVITPYATTGGQPGGSRLRVDGHLLSADSGGRILDVAPDRTVTVLAKSVSGQSLSGCNDLTVGEAGQVYFTGTDGGGVHLLKPDGSVTRIIQGMSSSNGIAVSGDQLLVADTLLGKVWSFGLDGDGLPTGEKSLRATVRNPDGILVDLRGNLWVASNAANYVYVFEPAGKLLRRFTLMPSQASNLAFGPPGSHLVYVTSGQPGCVHLLKLNPTDPLAAGLP